MTGRQDNNEDTVFHKGDVAGGQSAVALARLVGFRRKRKRHCKAARCLLRRAAGEGKRHADGGGT